jgi:hypothetical protein
MQLLILRASALALLEDEQKFKLGGGVLTAIISHFDHQLLGNNMSFTPYSIHILLISNKCNKFWMSCGCNKFQLLTSLRIRSPVSDGHRWPLSYISYQAYPH